MIRVEERSNELLECLGQISSTKASIPGNAGTLSQRTAVFQFLNIVFPQIDLLKQHLQCVESPFSFFLSQLCTPHFSTGTPLLTFYLIFPLGEKTIPQQRGQFKILASRKQMILSGCLFLLCFLQN